MIGADRPLLFLDVDGPLIPFGDPPPGGYPLHRSPYVPPGTVPGGNPLIARVDPELGPRLLALPGEPVWATTWLEDANECLAPWLGLPRLPVVDWPVEDTDPTDGPDGPDGPEDLHWKTRTLVAWADGRPFAWVDDEITRADSRWVAAHSPARALLHRVDPRRGLTEADFTALDAWLRTA
ncbi:HAD domain-containing protein [Kitasatospora sp. NPDC036755]|uniref:HAD domain-containing protein n=1 Tax=Kitasatospora sp. NPDC036755 TaxID=3154600 RepID=UPI0033C327F6